ncbi:hypothetical protein ACHHYP_06440 [Achlya hypogyna]|uniref:Uncharacterized protein n=1 Tax=Achlya hypogyna TaxID=1202772 RepID=A0A1V9YU12_ACHHY|nr:hypothetical protein ACHHYP_06440 [Achlya hypogyna]
MSALLKDADIDLDDSSPPLDDMRNSKLKDALWSSPRTSYELVTALYPADSWLHDEYRLLPLTLRAGNVTLAAKLLTILVARGGWYYNELHKNVLQLKPLEAVRRASVLKRNSSRITPLHVAAIDPEARHLRQLIQVGGAKALDAGDKAGWTPVHYASVCATAAPMQVLIEQGAKLDGTTKHKETPLYLASARGRADTITALVAAAPNRFAFIEVPGPDGNRPLHVAAMHGHADVVAVLLAAGAKVNVENASAVTETSFADFCKPAQTLTRPTRHVAPRSCTPS